jgi:hypothetical protein
MRRAVSVRRYVKVLCCLAVGAAALAAAGSRAARPASAEIIWQKVTLDKEFRSEGVAVADVNRDGKQDILAGSLWYEAPIWTPHEIAPVQKFDPAAGYSNCFLSWAADMNGDRWPDQIVVGFPGDRCFWRENRKGRAGHWTEHTIWRSACNESPAYVDLLGKKTRVLVFPYDEKFMAWYESDKDRAKEHICHTVGLEKQPGVERFSHGLGVGDVSGDGRADIITTQGYYEAPADRRSVPWHFVPAKLGDACAQMYVYDVNADGLPDVVSSSAHNVGVWWHEQKKGANGSEFVKHTIDDSFSQSHSLVMADINKDGVMDFVTGKRFWAHGPNGDVNPNHLAVLYWFELKRKNGQVDWIRHEIDNDSGVGTQFQVADVNGDHHLDVVTSNKKGVYLFLQQRSPGR